jgi:DNA-binding MarR family transcriptional regulator
MPSPRDIDAVLNLYPQIYFACHRRHAVADDAAAALSPKQAGILEHLDPVEPMNLRSLAKHMGVTASTMSLNVDRLERAGHVRRERAGDDARQVELRLTEAGRRWKRRQKVLDRRRIRALLQRLTAKERRKALGGLELLARAAMAMTASATEARPEPSKGSTS